MAKPSLLGAADCRRSGRAVVLLLASLGSLLVWLGTATQSQPRPNPQDTPEDFSDDSSDLPLAPPEEEPQVNDPAPQLVDPDEVADLPVATTHEENALPEPQGPRDRPPRHHFSSRGEIHNTDTWRPSTPTPSSSSVATSQHPHHVRGQPPVHDPAQVGDPDPLQQHDPGLPDQPTATVMPGMNNNLHQFTYYEAWSAWDEVDDYANDAPQSTTPQQAVDSMGMAQATMRDNHGRSMSSSRAASSTATRIGFATTYDPDSDPWHDSGMVDQDELGRPQADPSPGQLQPQRPQQAPRQELPSRQHALQSRQHPPPKQPPPRPHPQHQAQHQPQDQSRQGRHEAQPAQRTPPIDWSHLARTLANDGPLLPPQQWSRSTTPTASAVPTIPAQLDPQDDNSALPHLLQPAPQQPQPEMTEPAEQHTPPNPAAQGPEQVQVEPEEQPQCEASPPPPELTSASTCLRPQPAEGLEPQHTAAEDLTQDGAEEEDWITIPEEEGVQAPETWDDDEEEADADWISDVSDTDEEDLSPTPADTKNGQSRTGGNPPGGNPTKKAAGHGSQRVKNKARKSDVKKLWHQAGWGVKPEWLTWRAALPRLKRGEKPPEKKPLYSASNRERLAALLSAHQYVRDSQGNVIPTTPATSSSSSTATTPLQPTTQRGEPPPTGSHTPRATQSTASSASSQSDQPQPPSTGSVPELCHSGEPAPEVHGERRDQEDTTKASSQARQDHQQRLASNPYQRQLQDAPQRRHHQPQQPPVQQEPPARQVQPQRPQPAAQPQRGTRTVTFDLPPDHRDDPPKPLRQQKLLRKLTDSTALQLKFNGTSHHPVQMVDNRPEHQQMGGNPSQPQDGLRQEQDQGDVLFVQPAHLTASPVASSSASSGEDPTPPQPDIADLEAQAEQAVREGRAQQWIIEDSSSSMRSSLRIGNVSFDLSWYQGAGPPTLPPTIPIAPNVIFTARASMAGAWRGVLWSPVEGTTIRHPPRMRQEPSVVAYKTLSSPWSKGPTLSPGVSITLYPIGDWVATTRFELNFARTPRFWLLEVDTVPQVPAGSGELPLEAGQTFFLEWQGAIREWVRRPRFPGDIERLGGYATIPAPEPPKPPTPPERRGFPATSRGNRPDSSASTGATPATPTTRTAPSTTTTARSDTGTRSSTPSTSSSTERRHQGGTTPTIPNRRDELGIRVRNQLAQ